MKTERYLDQEKRWPSAGRHILAQHDADSVTVYQAYRPAIADYAAKHQRFGGEFSFSRMSWIKPNFLCMMYRSGWASKEGQEHVLAIRLRRDFFERILAAAVPSTYWPERYPMRDAWQQATASSEVRLQWDPDHDPAGRPLIRKAIQLGLRGTALREFATTAVVGIADITNFVREQRPMAAGDFSGLLCPVENVFVPSTREVAESVQLTTDP